MSLLTGSRLNLSANQWRWVGSLGLAFLAGVVTAISDSKTWPGLYTVFRDGLVEMVPVLVALKVIWRPRSAREMSKSLGQAAAAPDPLKGGRG